VKSGKERKSKIPLRFLSCYYLYSGLGPTHFTIRNKQKFIDKFATANPTIDTRLYLKKIKLEYCY